MKIKMSKPLLLLAIGLLVMNSGTVLSYFMNIEVHISDFLKGLGLALVLASLVFYSKLAKAGI